MQLEGPTILPQDWLILLAQQLAQNNYQPQPFLPQPLIQPTTTHSGQLPIPPMPSTYNQQAHKFIRHWYQHLPYLQQRYPNFLHQLSLATITPQLQLQFLLTIHHSGYTPATHPNHHNELTYTPWYPHPELDEDSEEPYSDESWCSELDQ